MHKDRGWRSTKAHGAKTNFQKCIDRLEHLPKKSMNVFRELALEATMSGDPIEMFKDVYVFNKSNYNNALATKELLIEMIEDEPTRS